LNAAKAATLAGWPFSPFASRYLNCCLLAEKPKTGIVKPQEPVMNEVVLRINDEINLDRVVSLLAPYIEKAEIKEPPRKIWTGKAEWHHLLRRIGRFATRPLPNTPTRRE
jgi:hypothetical protein